MGSTWGIPPLPHVASMGLDGNWALGVPWNGSMANALGFPWACIGAAHCEFHGSALWVGHWDVYMGFPWNCIDNAP